MVSVANVSDKIEARFKDFRGQLQKAFDETDDLPDVFNRANLLDDIWSFGPRKCGTNILLNRSDFVHQNVWNVNAANVKTGTEQTDDVRANLEYPFVNGFQLATLTGPLCEEPMHGVCFVIEEWRLSGMEDTNVSVGSVAGRLSQERERRISWKCGF